MLSIGVHECQYWLSLRCVAFYIVCMVLKAIQSPTARPAARLLSSSSSACSSSAEEERYEAHSTRSLSSSATVCGIWRMPNGVPLDMYRPLSSSVLSNHIASQPPADKAKSSVQLLVNFTGCHLTPHYHHHHHHYPVDIIVLGKSPVAGLAYYITKDNNRQCLVGLLTDLHMLLLSLFLLSFTTLPTIPVVDQFL